MMQKNRLSVIARPLEEHSWQVVAGDWDQPHGGYVVGSIQELGGTYEADVSEQPSRRQFFDNFKEAMDYVRRFVDKPSERNEVSAGSAP